eukprot:2623634-Pyramimonas_sp.AAC.1
MTGRLPSSPYHRCRRLGIPTKLREHHHHRPRLRWQIMGALYTVSIPLSASISVEQRLVINDTVSI